MLSCQLPASCSVPVGSVRYGRPSRCLRLPRLTIDCRCTACAPMLIPAPAVGVADLDHRARGCRSRFAACIITALGNMQPSQQMCWNVLVRLPVVVAQPVAGVLDDVELAVGVGRQAVAAGLVVGAGAVDRARRSGRRGSRSSTGAARAVSFCSASSRIAWSFQSKSAGRMRSSGAL